MKPGVIFSIAFIIVFGFLHVQPLLEEYEVKTETTCAKKKKQGCAKSTQSKKPCNPQKKDCNKGCNPFVPCSMGICCYIVEKGYSYAVTTFIANKKFSLITDNRFFSILNECCHHPDYRV